MGLSLTSLSTGSSDSGRVDIASKDGGSWGQDLSLVGNMEKSALTMYALFGGLVENLIRQPQALLSLHDSSY